MRNCVIALAAVAAFWASAALAQQTFGGNECTEDCSGHKAGYQWAKKEHLGSSRLQQQ